MGTRSMGTCKKNRNCFHVGKPPILGPMGAPWEPWLSILFQISRQVFVSTVENNLYKLYIGEKCIKRGFQFHKKYLQNNAVQEKSGKNKIPEKHIFFDKTGYRTTLGVPILINYSIFFSTLELAKFWFCKGPPFEISRVPIGYKKGVPHVEKFAKMFCMFP